jgi:hypothetical protein
MTSSEIAIEPKTVDTAARHQQFLAMKAKIDSAHKVRCSESKGNKTSVNAHRMRRSAKSARDPKLKAVDSQATPTSSSSDFVSSTQFESAIRVQPKTEENEDEEEKVSSMDSFAREEEQEETGSAHQNWTPAPVLTANERKRRQRERMSQAAKDAVMSKENESRRQRRAGMSDKEWMDYRMKQSGYERGKKLRSTAEELTTQRARDAQKHRRHRQKMAAMGRKRDRTRDTQVVSDFRLLKDTTKF